MEAKKTDNVVFVWRDWCVLGLQRPQSDCGTRDSLSDLGASLFIFPRTRCSKLVPPLFRPKCRNEITFQVEFANQGLKKRILPSMYYLFQKTTFNTSIFQLKSAFLKNAKFLRKRSTHPEKFLNMNFLSIPPFPIFSQDRVCLSFNIENDFSKEKVTDQLLNKHIFLFCHFFFNKIYEQFVFFFRKSV